MSMPMLQERGSPLGGLLKGLGMGVNQAMPSIQEMLVNRQKIKQREDLINRVEGSQSKGMSREQVDAQFINALPEIERSLGRELNPQDLDSIYSQFLSMNSSQNAPQDPFQKAKQYAMAGEHELARLETERAKIGEKERIARGEREFLPQKEYIQHAAKENIDFLNQVKQVERDIPTTEVSLAMIEDALGDAGKWAAAKDRLAEMTGYAGFKSSAGTELDSAIKNYFLGDLTSIKGGRLNQFLEKQVREAYMRAGQDPISNQKILAGMRMKEQINRIKVEKTRELEEKFLEKQGFLPSGFESIVNKSIREDIDKIEKDTVKKLHNMNKIQQSRDKIFRAHLKPGEILMMDAEGNPFAVKKKEVSAYREQGFIPMGEK